MVHPSGKKFAAFYSRFKRIRIYDRSVNLLHDIEVRTVPYSTEIQDDGKVQPVYYTGQPQVVGPYIFALCANSKENSPDMPNACELQVWDWEGNPVACYQFDRKLTYMAISEKYNKLYALDMAVADELYIYDLPELKNKKR